MPHAATLFWAGDQYAIAASDTRVDISCRLTGRLLLGLEARFFAQMAALLADSSVTGPVVRAETRTALIDRHRLTLVTRCRSVHLCPQLTIDGDTLQLDGMVLNDLAIWLHGCAGRPTTLRTVDEAGHHTLAARPGGGILYNPHTAAVNHTLELDATMADALADTLRLMAREPRSSLDGRVASQRTLDGVRLTICREDPSTWALVECNLHGSREFDLSPHSLFTLAGAIDAITSRQRA